MGRTFVTAMVTAGTFSLLAVADIALKGWEQLGVSGASLLIVFWWVTRTLPKLLMDERAAADGRFDAMMDIHRASIKAICDRLDVQTDLLSNALASPQKRNGGDE